MSVKTLWADDVARGESCRMVRKTASSTL